MLRVKMMIILFSLIVILASLGIAAAIWSHSQHQIQNENQPTSETGGSRPNSGIIYFIEGHDRFFNVISSAAIAIFTLVLAIATIRLWYSTAGLEQFAEQQAVDMKKSIAATTDIAKAASDANQLNRANFVATQRPWLTAANIAVGGPLFYNVNGANFTLQFVVKNVGHSPATHVWIETRVAAPAPGVDTNFDPRVFQQTLLDEMKTRPPLPFGVTIFPGDTITQNIQVSIPAEELKRVTQKIESIHPMIIGAIEYGFVFEDGRHRTGFIVEVRRSDRPRPESDAKKRYPGAIFPDEGDIPAADLQLIRSILGGEYAD
jgi:hypothetical protein